MNPLKPLISLINPGGVFDFSSLAQANKGSGVSASEAAQKFVKTVVDAAQNIVPKKQ
jgi:hypothetical protein